MFSDGQIAFAIFFLVVFAIGISWTYIFDSKKQKGYFKGSWLIFAILAGAFALISVMIRVIL